MSQSAPPPAAVRNLPIGATVAQAYAWVFSHLGLVLTATAFPFALSIGIVILSFLVGDSVVLRMVLVVLGFVPYTIFGVAWHRATLLGPTVGAPPLIPSWRPRHWRFFQYMFAVMLIGYAVAMPFVITVSFGTGADGRSILSPVEAAVLIAGSVALMIVLPYIMMRLSFVFPAVSVDETYGIGHAWVHSRGQGFRLLTVVFLTLLPMLLLFWPLGSVLGIYLLTDVSIQTGAEPTAAPETLGQLVFDSPVGFVLAQLLLTTINYVTMALVLSAISTAFRTCTGWVPPAAGPPVPARRDGGDAPFEGR